jgi:hypothetical protein
MLIFRLKDLIARSGRSWTRQPEETPVFELQRIMECARHEVTPLGCEPSAVALTGSKSPIRTR